MVEDEIIFLNPGDCFLWQDNELMMYSIMQVEECYANGDASAFDYTIDLSENFKGLDIGDMDEDYSSSLFKEMKPIPSSLLNAFKAIYKKYLDEIRRFVEQDRYDIPVSFQSGRVFDFYGDLVKIIEEKGSKWEVKFLLVRERDLSFGCDDEMSIDIYKEKLRPLHNETYDKVKTMIESAVNEALELIEPYK